MTTEGQQKPDTIEVDIHGVKVTLPRSDAEKIISGRDADKGKVREYNEKLGKLEADAAAAIAKAAKAEEDKAAAEHMKKGELDQARALLTKEYKDREAKLSSKARDKHLAALVASNDKIIKSAIPDIVEAMRGRTQYNFDTETVVVLDVAGQPQKDGDGNPMSVDSFISGWLEKRPHYLLDKLPTGTGGQGDKKQTSGKVITQSVFDSMEPRDRAAFFKDGGKVS